jgi:hypothetical protein
VREQLGDPCAVERRERDVDRRGRPVGRGERDARRRDGRFEGAVPVGESVDPPRQPVAADGNYPE